MSTTTLLNTDDVTVTYHRTSGIMWRVDAVARDDVGSWAAYTHFGPTADAHADARAWAISLLASRAQRACADILRFARAVVNLATAATYPAPGDEEGGR